MEAFGFIRRKLVIPRVPFGRQASPQLFIMHGLAEKSVFLAALGIIERPMLDHFFTVDQHDGSFTLGNAQHAGATHIEVKHFTRISKIELVNIVINRAALAPAHCWNAIAVIGKAGFPARTVIAFKVFHEIDFINPRRIAHLHHRPDKHPFCAELASLSAKKNPNWRLLAGLNPGCNVKTKYFRRFPHALWAHQILLEPVPWHPMIPPRFEMRFLFEILRHSCHTA